MFLFGDRRKKSMGQSTVEIVVLFMVVVAVLMVMRKYIKGSLIQKIKSDSDQISESKFSPDGLSSYTEESHSESDIVTETLPMGGQNKTINSQKQWGSSSIELKTLDSE